MFYIILCDMYKKNYLSVKLGSKLTQPFKFDVGVKQGDVLSPNIFKIFLLDLIAFATHFSNLILRPGHLHKEDNQYFYLRE